MPVEVKRTDERTIQIPVPAGKGDTQALAGFLMNCVSDGYVIKNARTIDNGSQRDPYVAGLRLVCEKKHA